MILRRLLLGLFLLSGAVALVYEILWMRLLILVFGSTTFAVSAALTSFMVGLALGAYFLGLLADRVARPLRLYAGLEAGIALSALILPQALHALSLVYPSLYVAAEQSAWLLPLSRLLLSFFILLIPCTLIGGTLPVLVRFVARSPEHFGRDFGWFYGMNTLGAVVGCLAAGFYLLGRLGLSATNLIAVGANLFLAAAFLVIDRRVPATPTPLSEGQGRTVPNLTTHEKIIVGIVVLSGLTVLGLEVLWTRALVQALLSTTYSFTAVLAALLLALALGSFISARWAVQQGPEFGHRLVERLVVIELLLAAALLAELPLLGDVFYLNGYYVSVAGPQWQVLGKFTTALVVILFPATLAGMLFPMCVQILSHRLEQVGGALGRVYLWNTVAAAGGALLAGFVLIPLLGVRTSYLSLVSVHVVVAMTLGFSVSRGRGWLAILPLVAIATVGAGRALARPELFKDPQVADPNLQMELIARKETADATFAVYRHLPTDFRFLHINGFVAASDQRMSQYMPMMAHLPLLLHPDPERVLVIAFGTGSTAGAASLHPIERLDIVDISRTVYELAPFFARANHEVLHDERTRAWVEDGRNLVQATQERFDVITSEPMPPKFATMVNFYSREYYQAAHARLTPNGVVCQWVPFHLITLEDTRMVVRTFIEVFPNASLWVIRGTGLLIGTKTATSLDPATIGERMSRPGVREDIARLGFESSEDLLASFVLDAPALRVFSGNALVVTDNNPYLEFSTDQPLSLSHQPSPVFEELRRLRAPPPLSLAGPP